MATAASPSGRLVASMERGWRVLVTELASGVVVRSLQVPMGKHWAGNLVFADEGTVLLGTAALGGLRWSLELTPPEELLDTSGTWTNLRLDADGEPIPVLPYPSDPRPWLPGAAPPEAGNQVRSGSG